MRIPRLFLRALFLRCPNCGGGNLFSSWLRMRRQCQTCGLELERGESGYQVGSYMFNIIASELLFAAVFLAVVVVMWPTPPWTLLEYGGIVMMVLAPLFFFPFSKTIFLAFALVFRPAAHHELLPSGADEAPRA